MSNINKLREKVAALLKRNEENGASEAEAVAAMSHAARLMQEHGITLEDIREGTAASTDFVEAHFNYGEKQLNVFDKLIANAIARYTDTKAWNDKSEKNVSKLMFFGYRVDVELAEYIREVCVRASETEWKKFSRNLPTGSRRSQRKSFLAGMALRLAERLDELKNENTQKINERDLGELKNENTRKIDGRDLVLVKSEMVNKAFAEKNGRMRSGGKVYYSANNAFDAGKTAAENVRFNRAVHAGPSGGVKLIA